LGRLGSLPTAALYSLFPISCYVFFHLDVVVVVVY
jgi:hypothetical protein